VAVVTLPFSLEGKRRMAQAMDGLAQLRDCVDSVIAIPNDRLLQTVARNTPVSEAFRVADDVLRQAVQGISDIITVHTRAHPLMTARTSAKSRVICRAR